MGNPEWQRIETAPKDYSVLVYIPNAEHYGEGVYRAILSSEFGSWSTFGLHVGRAVGASCWPTHWMPLPAPPEVKMVIEIEEEVEADEVESIRIAIRNRYSQIRELNKRLIEMGREPEDE